MSALIQSGNARFDNTYRHISLDELAQGLRDYESMPTLIQTALRRSVMLTLVTNVVSIPLLWLTPAFLSSLYPVESFFFRLYRRCCKFIVRSG